jgi:hypothetical protein
MTGEMENASLKYSGSEIKNGRGRYPLPPKIKVFDALETYKVLVH